MLTIVGELLCTPCLCLCCLGYVIFYTLFYDINLGFYDSFCVCHFSDPCIVTIYSNPFIERVVVPHPVACFTGADNLQEELGDFEEEINSESDDYDVVEKCAELVHSKHYKMFALGNNSVCLSGADTQNRYYINGTKDAECEDGIGKGDSMFVYSLGQC